MGMTLPSGTVTFLFTDIEGSTKLAREHPEAWETARAKHHVLLREAIESNNGFVFQIIGDAFCAALHTAGEALKAAARAQQSLQNEPWAEVVIRVRMGIHTGKAEIRPDGEYHGYLAMSRVQRLMSAGRGGQVLISAATQELLLEDLPENVSLRDLGERRLKDLIRPEHIYQLVIPDLPVEFPPLKTLDFYRHNLPVQLTSFIGREKEMEELKQSILTHRLVTLTGSGGTGKTRLALQVAADMLDQFPHGVWFVELAPLTDPDLIPTTILSAIGIPEQPGMTILQLLMDYLREKKIFLVLDNCEHLIEACAKLADRLLSNAHMLKIMTTSREALGIKGEVVWQVPSLTLPDVKQLPTIEQLSQYEAVQLFIERATLVQPHFMVTKENAPAIAQICFRLDGIPLAIELAAARVRALSVDQIAKRLDDRFRLLTGGSRTALERHQTLRAAIDWSYNLLSTEERRLLSRLSIFAGGWTLEAAEQVCAGNNHISSHDVLDLLTHLVDKSFGILDESRYRMLETTRQYAREKLFESEDGEMLRDQHLAYFLDLAEQADKEIHGPNQIEWMDRLEKDHDNFHLALDWSVSNKQTEFALRLLGALSWAWGWRGYFSEIQSWFDKMYALPDIHDYPGLYATLLNHIGFRLWYSGDLRNAKSVLEEARQIWLNLGVDGEGGLAETLDFLGLVALSGEEENMAAGSLLEESFELHQKHEDQWGMAMVMNDLGFFATFQGHYAQAEEQYMKSLTKFEELGDKLGVGFVLNGLGELSRLLGDYERAGRFYKQNLEFFQELGRRHLEIDFMNLAWVQLHIRDFHKAKALFKESLELSKDLGNKYVMAGCLMGFAGILAMIGKPDKAARLFGASESLLKGIARRMDAPDQKEFDHYVAVAREQLDKATFSKAWAEGQKMSLNEALDLALKTVEEME
jgi:predicted ATPase/class 3 adenylate cyclase